MKKLLFVLFWQFIILNIVQAQYLITQNYGGNYSSNIGAGQIFKPLVNAKIKSVTVYCKNTTPINTYFKIYQGPNEDLIYSKDNILLNGNSQATTIDLKDINDQYTSLDITQVYCFLFCLNSSCSKGGTYLDMEAGCHSPLGDYYLDGWAINGFNIVEGFDSAIDFNSCDLKFRMEFLPPSPNIKYKKKYINDSISILISTGQNTKWYLDEARSKFIQATDTLILKDSLINYYTYFATQTIDSIEGELARYDIPMANFKFDTTICHHDTVEISFIGNATDTSQYFWNFNGGNVITGNAMGPYIITWDDYGKKEISLYLVDNGIVSDTLVKSLTIFSIPSSYFEFDTNKLCATDTVLISYIGTGTNYANYTWNFDSGNVITGFGQGDYQINWSNSGVKAISLAVEENGCFSDTTAKQLNVYQIPTSQFSMPESSCDTNYVVISYTGNASDTANYLWNFDGSNIISGTNQDDYEIYWDSIGSKNVSLIVEENGCYSDTTTNMISVFSTPSSEFIIDTNKLCNSDTALISYIGTGITNANYYWDFNQGNIIYGSGQGEYQINWSNSGLKTIGLSVEENGCFSDTTYQALKVYQPNSSFSLDDIVCENQNTSIVYTGEASDSATYYWDFDSANIIEGNEIGPYIVYWDSIGNKNVSLVINDNGCYSTTSKTIQHNTIPTSIFEAPDKLCFDGIADIEFIGTASDTANYSWDFDNGSVLTGTGVGPYEVKWDSIGIRTVSLLVSENGCSSDTSLNLTINQQTEPISICMVSVDSSNHNMIVWEQPLDNPYDSIIIYKETSQSDVYEKISSHLASNISVYIDENSNPAQNSSRYKIAVLDTCGYETPVSDYHKTMHLTVSAGIGGVWNLIWDDYEGFSFSTYNIYRGTSDNSLMKIAEQANNTFTYTDLNPPIETAYYQIEVVNPSPCNVSNLKSSNDYYSSTRSNIVRSIPVLTQDNTLFKGIQIYPNPANNKLYIKSLQNMNDYDIEILSIDGKLQIKKQNIPLNTEIDISNLSRGMYLLKIKSNNKSLITKIIKK